jgi:NAD(P)H-hydrate epimerase
MVRGLPTKDGVLARAARPEIEQMVADATAVGCGPGMGRSDVLTSIVGWLYAHCRRPVVFDADALNALAERPDFFVAPAAPRILTPHPGEFGRLVGLPVAEALAKREKLADQLAESSKSIVLVKGHRTYITDGTQRAVNETGNPGLATGGTGDVLTGVITALLCQGMEAFDAARLGAHLHGLAGDLAAADLGQVSLIASDLPKYLPAAFKSLAGGSFNVLP